MIEIDIDERSQMRMIDNVNNQIESVLLPTWSGASGE